MFGNHNMKTITLLILYFIYPWIGKSQEVQLNGCFRANSNLIYEFKQDKFDFIGVYGHALRTGKGVYYIRNDSILLVYNPDTIKFYSIQMCFDKYIHHDSVLLKMTYKSNEPLIGANIISDSAQRLIMTNDSGKIKISKYQFPIKIQYVDCKPIILTKLDIEESNSFLINWDLEKCTPSITGFEVYPFKILNDTLLINGIIYKRDYKKINKIQIIE
jgi:hypothetical protein